MRKLEPKLVILLSMMSAAVILAQTDEQPKPRFKLTLSMGRTPGEFSKGMQVIIVRLTNTSNDLIREDTCSAFGCLYKLSVVYNGVPLDEPEEKRKHREDMERGEAAGGLCFGSNPGHHIKPGEYWKDLIYYRTTKPGTYEFTVEKKTFPQGPGEGVKVKSSTITFVVPESGAGAPAGELMLRFPHCDIFTLTNADCLERQG